jgi:hypothetical protein
MRRTRRFQQIVSLLILPLLLATSLAARVPQTEGRAEMSLTISPARATLIAGQPQKFSAHIEGASAGTVARWAITDGRRDGSSISQDGVFTAGLLGVYRVVAFAVDRDGTVSRVSIAKVTVLGESEF